ncbi:MAG: FtsX-like permease family protein, partial [Acidobacteriota bacterium]
MRPYTALLRSLAWRRVHQEPIRMGLTVLGVALGVGVFLSIQLANGAAVLAFRNSLDAVSGKTQLQLTAGDVGIPEDLFLRVREWPGVKRAAPVIQQTAWIRKRGSKSRPWKRRTPSQGRAVLVLGMDLLGDADFRSYKLEEQVSLEERLERLADPQGLFLTRGLADELGVGQGAEVELDAAHRLVFRVRGILENNGLGNAMEGRLVIMDIGVAQEAFGRLDRLDRIDLILERKADIGEVQAHLQEQMPPGVIVARPMRRGEDVDKMLASFKLNLTVLSVIALLVGCFLIFNTMSASVTRRRPEIATLRALGLNARQVAVLFTLESACIGFIGSSLGLLLGVWLASRALSAVANTISNLYAFLHVTKVQPDPLILLAALGIGTVAAIFSGLWPALRAAGISPVQEMRTSSGAGELSPRRLSIFWVLFAVSAMLAYALGQLPPWGGRPVFGYLAAGMVVAALAFLSPAAVCAGAAALQGILANHPLGWLGAHGLGRHPGRNAVTVASLATAMALLTSLVVMIESFRDTVMVWTHQTLQADLYAAPASRFIKGSAVSFPGRVLERVRDIEGVAAVEGFRNIRLPWRGTFVNVAGGNLRIVAERSGLLFREGDSESVLKNAVRNEEAIVTETFALRFDIREGDTLQFAAPGGEVQLRVAGVFYDYTTEGGRVVVDGALFRKIWRDDRLSSMAIYLKKGANRQKVIRQIEPVLDPTMVLISNAGLRKRVLEVFDQTFAITYALEAIAVLVAILGVATGLSSNILERRREIGILRSLGLTRRGVLWSVVGEAGFLGIISA